MCDGCEVNKTVSHDLFYSAFRVDVFVKPAIVGSGTQLTDRTSGRGVVGRQINPTELLHIPAGAAQLA